MKTDFINIFNILMTMHVVKYNINVASELVEIARSHQILQQLPITHMNFSQKEIIDSIHFENFPTRDVILFMTNEIKTFVPIDNEIRVLTQNTTQIVLHNFGKESEYDFVSRQQNDINPEFKSNLVFTLNTKLIFFLQNLTELPRYNDELKDNPSLIKIIYTIEDCTDNITEITAYFDNLWMQERIANIFYTSRCSTNPKLIKFYFYNNNDKRLINIIDHNDERRAMIASMDLDNDGMVTMTNVRETFLNGRHAYNLHNITLRCALFPSSMAYLKSTTLHLAKTLTQSEIANELTTLNAFFGLDISIIHELSVRMNFTLKIKELTDDNLYGYKVSN